MLRGPEGGGPTPGATSPYRQEHCTLPGGRWPELSLLPPGEGFSSLQREMLLPHGDAISHLRLVRIGPGSRPIVGEDDLMLGRTT